MDREINPLAATLVFLMLFLLFMAYLWSDGMVQGISGPGHMHRDAQGNLYISSHNHLLKYDAQGVLVEDFALEKLGIERLTGDFAVFADGDLLLSPVSFDPGFFEGLATYLRREELTQTQGGDGSGLDRCNMQTLHCRQFIAGDTRYDHTFFLEVNQVSGEVYVADTSRHQVVKFDASGKEVARNNNDWEYPNQALLAGDRLLVVDTNHFRIRALDVHSPTLADLPEGMRNGMPEEARRAGHRFPATMTRFGDQWWLIVMNNAMRGGGIYRFDDQWVYQGTVELPGDAEPLGMLPLGDRVLVSDPIAMKIYQFDDQSQRRDDFAPDTLRRHVDQVRQEQQHYRVLGRELMAVVVFALALAFYAAYRTGKRPDSPLPETMPAESQQPVFDDGQITWLEPDKGLFRRKYFLPLGVSYIVVSAVVALMLVDSKSVDVVLVSEFFFLLIGLPALTVYLLRVQYGSRIGYLGNSLIVRDHRGRTAIGRGKYILYNTNLLIIDKVMVALGNSNLPIYKPVDLVQHVFPRLKEATAVTQRQVQTLMMRNYQPIIMVVLLLLFGGLAFLLFR